MRKEHLLLGLNIIALTCATNVYSATTVNLKSHSASFLTSFLMKETSRHTDFNGVTHIRVQQVYKEVPVWGADAIIHVQPNHSTSLSSLDNSITMNGSFYAGIASDLGGNAAPTTQPNQATLALEASVKLSQNQSGAIHPDLKHSKVEPLVYVDKDNKAHWAYYVTFLAYTADGKPMVPTYIVDAQNFHSYASWNNLQSLGTVTGGGFGGNPKMGKLVYDGGTGNYPSLQMTRNAKKSLCTLETDDISVQDDTDSSGPFSDSPTAQFTCTATDSQHNNVYWDGALQSVNGGYSPVNDALYIGTVVNDMYNEWYHLPVLAIFGMPIPIILHAHAKDLFGSEMDNAFFFPLTMQMYFGDGVDLFYPLTSLGVGAHELSHGFTSQHSNLTYEKQSGGLNESFSDMAAQAGEYFATGKNSWQIGPEIVKGEGALRYMDDPTKDGKSIAHVSRYTDDLNVHYSSGIFNKVFYLLGTAEGWNTKKAFDVMVKANVDYWNANSTFANAACGVISAARDYGYPLPAVKKALRKVGLKPKLC